MFSLPDWFIRYVTFPNVVLYKRFNSDKLAPSSCTLQTQEVFLFLEHTILLEMEFDIAFYTMAYCGKGSTRQSTPYRMYLKCPCLLYELCCYTPRHKGPILCQQDGSPYFFCLMLLEDSPNRARGNRISAILGRTVYRNDVTSFGDMVDRPMRRIISDAARRRISTDQCRAVFS